MITTWVNAKYKSNACGNWFIIRQWWEKRLITTCMKTWLRENKRDHICLDIKFVNLIKDNLIKHGKWEHGLLACEPTLIKHGLNTP